MPHSTDKKGRNPAPTNAVPALDGDDSHAVGVVEEGFEWDISTTSVDETGRDAMRTFDDIGNGVESISIPWHTESTTIYNGVFIETFANFVSDEGIPSYRQEPQNVEFCRVFVDLRRRFWAVRSSSVSPVMDWVNLYLS